jgi:hypothetical protein
MIAMFGRSREKHNLRYTAYIADGDTKNDVNIAQARPYGDLVIERKQCINHFSKRMKTRLTTIKKKHGRTPLSDRKTIGGKGRLGMASHCAIKGRIEMNMTLFRRFEDLSLANLFWKGNS